MKIGLYYTNTTCKYLRYYLFIYFWKANSTED